MHSSLVRLQQVFGFLTSVSFALATLIALSSYLFPHTATADLELSNINVIKGRSGYYSSRANEYALIKFDLDADLTSLWNWNTKQIFLYITAKYPGERYVDNESVIWDKIVTKKSKSKLSYKGIKSKYNIHDITGDFHSRNATLGFYWNVQPHVGVLQWDGVGNSKEFKFPAAKAKAKTGK